MMSEGTFLKPVAKWNTDELIRSIDLRVVDIRKLIRVLNCERK